MSQRHFSRRLNGLRLLLLGQRGLRLLLRSAWIGLGGYLLAWGGNQLWGWLPEPESWAFVGAGLALLPLAGIVFPWPGWPRLTWRLDRAFRLKEQVSAAWQVSRAEAAGPLGSLLLDDAAALLPPIRRRVLWRGWHLLRDAFACLIVGLLFWLARADALTIPHFQIPAAEALALPAPAGDPQASEVLPSGIPGFEPAPPAGQNSAGGSDNPGAGEATPGQSLPADVQSALRDLGSALSQQAPTQAIGQALRRGDLSQAAQGLGVLSDQAGGMSPLSRLGLSSPFSRAGQQLGGSPSQTGQELSQALQEAAEGLRGDPEQASEALDRLARMLAELAGQGAGEAPQDGDQGGAGSGGSDGSDSAGREQGAPQPIERLYGESGTLQLAEDEGEGGILGQGLGGDGDDLAAGDSQQLTISDSRMVTSTLTPYGFYWRWRDVVAEYFAPR